MTKREVSDETATDPPRAGRGADLWREEIVFVADAALGSTLTVPTLEGKTAVKLPPGTQPDAALRLRGKGLPRFRGQGRGDLFIRLRVQVPEKLSREEKELYERLRSLATKPSKGRPIRRKRPSDIDEKGRIDDRDKSRPQIDPAHIGLPDTQQS